MISISRSSIQNPTQATPEIRPPKPSAPYLPALPSHNPNTSITARTASKSPTFKITIQKTDQRYPHLDLSKLPLTEVLDKLTSAGATKWVNEYTTRIAQGVTLSMPAMVETTQKIKKLLQRFKTLYTLTTEEVTFLDHFNHSLNDNAKRGYPSLASEQLTLCFCYIRDCFLEQFAPRGSVEWPAHLEFDQDMLKYVCGITLSNITKIDWAQQLRRDHKKSMDPIKGLERVYYASFNTNTVRVLCMDDLSIQIFNQTFALDVTLIGVLNEHGMAFHDSFVMTSSVFMRHDGFHAEERHRAFAKHSKQTINLLRSCINDYHQQIRPRLTEKMSVIIDYLLFISTHETAGILSNKDTTFPLLFYGFGEEKLGYFFKLSMGVKDDTDDEPSPVFLSDPPTAHQQWIKQLLHEVGSVDIAYKFFKTFKQSFHAARRYNTAFNIHEVTDTLPRWAWKKTASSKRKKLAQ